MLAHRLGRAHHGRRVTRHTNALDRPSVPRM